MNDSTKTSKDTKKTRTDKPLKLKSGLRAGYLWP